MTEVLLYGEVGYDFDAKWLNSALADADGDVTLRVHSPGGDVFEGVAIANSIRRARARGRRVHAVVDGLAASAASYMCLTCDEVLAGPGAVFMVHRPSGACCGTADEMRAVARALDTCDATIRELYALHSGRPADQIADAMADETWMTADEAVAFGLADGRDGGDAPDLSLVDSRWAGACDSAELAAFAADHRELAAAMDGIRSSSEFFRDRLEAAREFGNRAVDDTRPTLPATDEDRDGDVEATDAVGAGAAPYAVANGHVYRIGNPRE